MQSEYSMAGVIGLPIGNGSDGAGQRRLSPSAFPVSNVHSAIDSAAQNRRSLAIGSDMSSHSRVGTDALPLLPSITDSLLGAPAVPFSTPGNTANDVLFAPHLLSEGEAQAPFGQSASYMSSAPTPPAPVFLEFGPPDEDDREGAAEQVPGPQPAPAQGTKKRFLHKREARALDMIALPTGFVPKVFPASTEQPTEAPSKRRRRDAAPIATAGPASASAVPSGGPVHADSPAHDLVPVHDYGSDASEGQATPAGASSSEPQEHASHGPMVKLEPRATSLRLLLEQIYGSASFSSADPSSRSTLTLGEVLAAAREKWSKALSVIESNSASSQNGSLAFYLHVEGTGAAYLTSFRHDGVTDLISIPAESKLLKIENGTKATCTLPGLIFEKLRPKNVKLTKPAGVTSEEPKAIAETSEIRDLRIDDLLSIFSRSANDELVLKYDLVFAEVSDMTFSHQDRIADILFELIPKTMKTDKTKAFIGSLSEAAVSGVQALLTVSKSK